MKKNIDPILIFILIFFYFYIDFFIDFDGSKVSKIFF